MATSLRQIAEFMDPVDPPLGLRALAARHRWISGHPPSPISLAEIARRHESQATTRHRFLWYNTFLLQGFTLSPCDIPEMLDRILHEAGYNPRDLLDQLGLSPTQIAEAMQWSKDQLYENVLKPLGIGLDELKSAFGDVVDALLNAPGDVLEVVTGGAVDVPDISVGDILAEVSVADLLETFNVSVDQLLTAMKVDPLTVLTRFCEETLDFVSSALPVPVSTQIEIKPKPERHQRAREIGQVIGPDYEIVALCEVFEEESQSSIRAHAAASGRSVHVAIGPDDSGHLASSGLMTLAIDRPIAGIERKTFNNRGQYCCDSDAWANKGVLLTRIDVGLGILEVYSTHLLSGGDIADFLTPSEAVTESTKQLQVDELIAFYEQHHDPRNVAMVVGDFNISADNASRYDQLVGKLHALGLLDAWPFHRHRESPGHADNAGVPRGDTHASGESTGTLVDLPGAPPVPGAVDSSRVGDVCVPATGPFCIDGQEDPAKKTSRIDYVFVENPTSQHTFTLDFTRIRRRPFARTGDNVVTELWLSDHLGLDLKLVVSPK